MRWLNIALRTAHIGAMGVLLGGHAFGVAAERLLPVLYLTIGTGLALAAHESRFRPLWLHQGRGLLTLVKLGLVALVAVLWEQRLFLLLAVVVLASVGSHMPARFRYYSVLRREVVKDAAGPNGERPGQ